jgi:hypothetical protein
MLNTWTQNAVHRDADRLMDLAPQIAERYCRLDLATAREKIHADFADGPRRIDEHLCRFSRADFPQFEFSLHIGLSRDRLALSVHGRDRYQGFMLQTVDGPALVCVGVGRHHLSGGGRSPNAARRRGGALRGPQYGSRASRSGASGPIVN